MGQTKRSQKRQLGLITHPVVKQMINETETMDTHPQTDLSLTDGPHTGSMYPLGQTRQRPQEGNSLLKLKSQTRIGCWNVRTLYQTGKLAQLAKEMQHYNLSIIGVCESRQNTFGEITTATGATFLYSGNPKEEDPHTHGVGLLLSKDTSRITDDAIRYLELAIAMEPTHIQSLLTLGEFYYERRLYRLSQSYYTKILDIEYQNEKARLSLGLIALKNKDDENAYSIFRELIEAENSNVGATASALLGDKYLDENNFEVAEQMYLKSLAYNFSQPNVADNLANLYIELADYDGMIRIYLQILENSPNNKEALETLGNIYTQKGEYNKALEYYKRLYRASDDPYYASFLIASTSYISKRYSEAEKYYKKVINENRKGEAYRDSLFYLGEIYSFKRSYRKSLSYYKRALELQNDENFIEMSIIHKNIGNIYLKSNDIKNASEHLLKAWQINKDDPSSLLALASYYQSVNEKTRALNIYNEVEKTHHENKDALFAIGTIYAENKQYDKSNLYLIKVAENTDNNENMRSEAFLTLAHISTTLDDHRHAIRYYEKSITIKPSSKNYFSYGNYLYDMGRYENAILVFQKALSYKPNRNISSDIAYALGNSYNKMNDIEEAKKAYTFAVKNNRKNLEAVHRRLPVSSLFARPIH